MISRKASNGITYICYACAMSWLVATVVKGITGTVLAILLLAVSVFLIIKDRPSDQEERNPLLIDVAIALSIVIGAFDHECLPLTICMGAGASMQIISWISEKRYSGKRWKELLSEECPPTIVVFISAVVLLNLVFSGLRDNRYVNVLCLAVLVVLINWHRIRISD